MANTKKPEITKEELQKAQDSWINFGKWTKWSVIAIVVILALMAIALI